MIEQLSVLVVDDQALFREIANSMFETTGEFTVIAEAEDGVDALRKLAGARFDLIVTDINMPIMDGLKLVKRIRSDQAHKDVPVIIITTEGSTEDRQRAMALGANAYITKPIQAPQVIAKVKELLTIE